MRWCCGAPYCRLLFILSRRFFRSSRLAAGEAERVCACVGEWVCSCWYSSLDSLSWDSLLWSISVEEATDGFEDSREEMGGRCWGSSSLPMTPCWRLRDERLGEIHFWNVAVQTLKLQKQLHCLEMSSVIYTVWLLCNWTRIFNVVSWQKTPSSNINSYAKAEQFKDCVHFSERCCKWDFRQMTTESCICALLLRQKESHTFLKL